MRRLSVLLGVTEELAERVASSALEGDSVSRWSLFLPAPGEEFLLVLDHSIMTSEPASLK